jgi:23S rRNA (pseudouridine1915-N3)-methyltransferase
MQGCWGANWENRIVVKIHLISVGSRMPAWVEAGFGEYAKRLAGECILKLHEIPQAKGKKNDNPRVAMADEGGRMLKALPGASRVVALDLSGKSWSTPQLADRCAAWQQDGRDVALLIGGPDGLAPACLERADERWALSALTFPHPLVRVIVAEQLYRAWSILNNHPYHRA